MKLKKPVLILIAVLVIAWLAGCQGSPRSVDSGAGNSKSADPGPGNSGPIESGAINSGTIKCKYYDPQDFQSSVSNLPNRQMGRLKVRGGVVPHHLLANRMIAGFFKVLAAQEPEVVVVLGPDHQGLGLRSASTADGDWETPYGILQAEKSLVNRLVKDKSAGLENRLFEQEHSVSVLVPYLKYYLPNAKIVPVLVKGNCSQERSGELGRELEKLVGNKNYIIIAAVDFSHYLTAKQADEKDQITLRAFKNKDLQAISRLGNANLDSPPAVISLLTAMTGAGAGRFTVLGHDNSARISGVDTGSTTSYFTMLFHE